MNMLIATLIVASQIASQHYHVTVTTQDIKAVTLAVMVEAGGLSDREKEVIVHALINRQRVNAKYGRYYSSIQVYIRAHQVMDGFGSVDEAYEWYSGRSEKSPFHPNGHPNFAAASYFVTNFFISPRPDFTQGAIQWKHAESYGGAAWLACYYSRFTTEEIADFIRPKAEVILNGEKFHIGAEGVTVFTNMNFTPTLPENADKILCVIPRVDILEQSPTIEDVNT